MTLEAGPPDDPFEIQHPHDGLFGYLFSTPANARVLLEGALPAAVLAELDLAALAPQRTKSHGEALQRLEGDLLFETRLRGGQPALVRILIEHQSTQDWFMAWRVHQYKLRDTAAWLARHRGARTLPAVLAVVVYHGESRWQAPRRLTQLYDLPASQLDLLRDGLAEDSYQLEDLAARSEHELLTRQGPPAAVLGLILMREVVRTGSDVLGLLRRAKPLLRAFGRTEDSERVFVAFVLYIGATAASRVDVAELTNLARETMGEQGARTVTTLADRLRAEGRAEGSLAGQRAFLLSLLEEAFGALPDQVRVRVEGGSERELRLWGMRYRQVSTLAEVFAEE